MSSTLTDLPGTLGISAVERETGLTKDVLRVWERRYGFPTPLRNTYGERVYPDAQVAKLRLVKRLLDAGMRPAGLLPLDMDALNALLQERAGPTVERCAEQDQALHLIRTHQITALRRELNQAVVRDGLRRFVTHTCAPLAAMVGEAWMRGEIRIFEEHLFTEQLQSVLRGAIAQAGTSGGAPRVLMTTLPGEQHGLGLLMAEAMFVLEGAECLSLGLQTPVGDIAAAAMVKRIDVVALSVSSVFPQAQLIESLTLLRAALPSGTGLWCGGGGMSAARRVPEGILRLETLDDIGTAISAWHQSRRADAACGPEAAPDK